MENDLTLLELCYLKKCQEVDKLKAEIKSILEVMTRDIDRVDYTKNRLCGSLMIRQLGCGNTKCGAVL